MVCTVCLFPPVFCNVGQNQMTITYYFFFKCYIREYAGKKCLGTLALTWIFCKLIYQPCFSLQWLLFCSKTCNTILHITFQAVCWSCPRTYTERKWVISMLNLTLHFFSPDSRLLSSYNFERYCSKLLILKATSHTQCFKEKLRSEG